MRGIFPIATLLLVAGTGGLAVGCASWEAARLYERGSRALEQGEVELALADLEAAATLVPGAAPVHNQLGLARLAAGDEAGALRSFEVASELDCDDPVARHNRDRLAARMAREAAIAAVSSPRPPAEPLSPEPAADRTTPRGGRSP